jgi:hypothetical protein
MWNECKVTGKAVELCDDELGPVTSAGLNSLCQRWPIAALSVLDFREFRHKVPLTTVQIVPYGRRRDYGANGIGLLK